MTHSLHTGLYRLDTHDFDQNTAHLYEHLLINAFYRHAEASGISMKALGWVGGETFDRHMFIEYGLYSNEPAILLDEFLQHSSRINLDDLAVCLKQIAAEDRSTVTVPNNDTLHAALTKLDALRFINLDKDTGPARMTQSHSEHEQIKAITLRRNAKAFRDYTVIFELGDLTPDQLALACRLSPILHDASAQVAHSLGAYERRSTLVMKHSAEEPPILVGIFTLPKNITTIRNIKQMIIDAITELHCTEKDASALNRYFNVFAYSPDYHYMPVSYYKYTGVLTSRARIAALATTENINTIFDSIAVHVLPTTPKHWAMTD